MSEQARAAAKRLESMVATLPPAAETEDMLRRELDGALARCRSHGDLAGCVSLLNMVASLHPDLGREYMATRLSLIAFLDPAHGLCEAHRAMTDCDGNCEELLVLAGALLHLAEKRRRQGSPALGFAALALSAFEAADAALAAAGEAALHDPDLYLWIGIGRAKAFLHLDQRAAAGKVITQLRQRLAVGGGDSLPFFGVMLDEISGAVFRRVPA